MNRVSSTFYHYGGCGGVLAVVISFRHRGTIMRQYALVVVGATLMSLFVSFTVTPTLASRFAKLERLTERTLLGRFALAFEKLYHRFSDFYQKMLKWLL